MPQPEIAFDLTPLQNAHQYRGIGTYVRGLAKRLSEQTEIPIEFWAWSGGSSISPQAPHTALLLPRIPMPKYRGAWLFAQLAMRRRARTSKVRAIHLTDPEALTPLAGRKLLATVYDLIPLKQGLGSSRVLARTGYQNYMKSLAKADMLFAISEQTAGDLIEMLRIPGSRIKLARPGVDLPKPSGSAVKRAKPYFLFLGGPNPNKNLAVLLDAMVQCTDLDQEVRVGGHWLPKQVASLERQIESGGLKGRVRFVGFVPAEELAGLMRDATALVIPSLMEGFGLPVAEGLAAGALVIHSRLPVLQEISAGAALMFDPNSAADLAAALRRAATDTAVAKELRKKGMERAKKLTWNAAVETTLATYRSILDA